MLGPLTIPPRPAAAGPSPAVSRVGSELRDARLRRGWTLADAAARLRIRPAYLEAIEDGRFAALPGNAYAVNFVRSYAGALGLHPDEVARRYRAEARDADRPTKLIFPAPAADGRVPAGAVVLLGALLALGGYAGWYHRGAGVRTLAEPVPLVPDRLALLADRPSPPAAAVSAPGTDPETSVTLSDAAASAPVPAPAPAPMPAPLPVTVPANSAAAAGMPLPAAEEGRIVLRASADAWVQVRERGGPVLLSRLMRDGESWPVPPGPTFLLTTGNAGGVELLVDGVAVPPLGGAGAVRRDVPLDADAIKLGRPAGVASTARLQAQ